ncbi:MAG: hypothetical protein GXO78_11925 [Calditrichaeota bacterium]|nr:hypothetical protein [Calditrichota bacterium]
MRDRQVLHLARTALFVAAGVVIPQFFHLLGLGAVFLPMFIPVMLGSMFLPLPLAGVLALVTPVLSWSITGMPPLMPPILPVVTLELLVVAVVISGLHYHRGVSPIAVLLLAIIADRLLLWLIVRWLAPALGWTHPIFSLSLVFSGIPGIVLQLLVIPAAVHFIKQRVNGIPHSAVEWED